MDVLFLGVTFAFFAIAVLYVAACEHLKGDRS